MENRAAASDAVVVELIAQGDQAAETELYGRFARRVYYLALRKMRSPADAEDIRAETFLRVVRAIRENRLRSPDALSGFVLATARNVIREVGRAHRRTDALFVDDPESREPGALDAHFLDDGVVGAIDRAIGRMRPREKSFLRLFYYEELTSDEVARRLGIPRERLRLIKSRALKRFRECYEQVTKA